MLLPCLAEEVSLYQDKQTCCERRTQAKNAILCRWLKSRVEDKSLYTSSEGRWPLPQRNTTTGVGSPIFLFWPHWTSFPFYPLLSLATVHNWHSKGLNSQALDFLRLSIFSWAFLIVSDIRNTLQPCCFDLAGLFFSHFTLFLIWLQFITGTQKDASFGSAEIEHLSTRNGDLRLYHTLMVNQKQDTSLENWPYIRRAAMEMEGIQASVYDKSEPL